MSESIKVIAFDADDTLWVNEPFFREAERKLGELLSEYASQDVVHEELYEIEIGNLEPYGFGIKAFCLSMIETAIKISDGKVSPATISSIMEIAKEMLRKPVDLLDGIEEVLPELAKNGYILIVATKGDLLDQERKLAKSGLEKHFHHIEIMSDKKEENYTRLLSHLDVEPEEFLMIGNSLKSDILPVLELGGKAVFVPFLTSWVHERVDGKPKSQNFFEIDNIRGIFSVLEKIFDK